MQYAVCSGAHVIFRQRGACRREQFRWLEKEGISTEINYMITCFNTQGKKPAFWNKMNDEWGVVGGGGGPCQMPTLKIKVRERRALGTVGKGSIQEDMEKQAGAASGGRGKYWQRSSSSNKNLAILKWILLCGLIRFFGKFYKINSNNIDDLDKMEIIAYFTKYRCSWPSVRGWVKKEGNV